ARRLARDALRRFVRRELLVPRLQLAERSLRVPGPDAARVPKLVTVVHRGHDRPAVPPAGPDDIGVERRLHLEPRSASSGLVPRVESLRDDAFEALRPG